MSIDCQYKPTQLRFVCVSVAMISNEEALSQIEEFVVCPFCNQLPFRPVMFPKCGHSVVCEACARLAKPKQCSVCGEANATPSTKLKLNKTLHSVFACLFAEQYNCRGSEHDLSTTANLIETNISIKALINSIESLNNQHQNVLPLKYIDTAKKIIHLHHTQEGKGKTKLKARCKCDLICIPKCTRKSGICRYFLSCPLWTPVSQKYTIQKDETRPPYVTESDMPLSYCNHFTWLSEKQVAVFVEQKLIDVQKTTVEAKRQKTQ